MQIPMVGFGHRQIPICTDRRPSSCTSSGPSPPTKSLDFGGFDASKLLIVRGGNSHVRMIL